LRQDEIRRSASQRGEVREKKRLQRLPRYNPHFYWPIYVTGCNGVRFFADCAAKKWPLPGQQESDILPVNTNIDNFLSMLARNRVTAVTAFFRCLEIVFFLAIFSSA
jgi:hypothetical protein